MEGNFVHILWCKSDVFTFRCRNLSFCVYVFRVVCGCVALEFVCVQEAFCLTPAQTEFVSQGCWRHALLDLTNVQLVLWPDNFPPCPFEKVEHIIHRKGCLLSSCSPLLILHNANRHAHLCQLFPTACPSQRDIGAWVSIRGCLWTKF